MNMLIAYLLHLQYMTGLLDSIPASLLPLTHLVKTPH